MKHFYTRTEKILLLLLLIIMAASSYLLYNKFILANSEAIPTTGGIYNEGMVGKPMLLNPLFSYKNPVDRDIVQLIFSGLTKYNPQTGTIEDDLAVSARSENNLTYTFTLLPNLKWHDGHPVTSEDILFTYQTMIQNDSLKNGFLYETFRDVKITKIDNRTVTFTLNQPYSFFLSAVTVGILPKHILELVPPQNLEKSDFNLAPIGTGPYIFKSWVEKDDIVDITLSRNPSFYGTVAKIETLLLRVFPTVEKRLLAEDTLNGFKIHPSLLGNYGQESRFNSYFYQLPQYVALFLNTESQILSNKKTRFGLLLATDKESLAKELKQVQVVDTPVLESKTGLDIEYNEERAKGAFFDTEWYIPSKLPEKTGEKKSQTVTSTNPKTSDLTFTITASSDSWITPKPDGEEKVGFILEKGSAKSFTVKESLTFVSIGNAGGVIIDLNGEKLKKLGDEGQVLRNITLSVGTIGNYLTPEQVGTLFPATPTTTEAPQLPNIPELPQEEQQLIRINTKGERLILKLITAQNPPEYLQAAEMIQKQWKQAGVKLIVETYPKEDLEKKIQTRDYDVLLFGQNLGYNLDAFPFWHSSQSENGLNLSQHTNIGTDSLLVEIRKTFTDDKKQILLNQLKKNIAENTPAIFLYSPTQVILIDKKIRNVNLNHLATDADRFSDTTNWYIKEDYKLTTPFSLSTFFSWLWTEE